MKPIISNNIAFITTLTLKELAYAYNLKLETLGDIETLFDYIKNDIVNEGLRLIYGRGWYE